MKVEIFITVRDSPGWYDEKQVEKIFTMEASNSKVLKTLAVNFSLSEMLLDAIQERVEKKDDEPADDVESP